MPRPIWTGTLDVGLVSVPVELHSATEDRRVSFAQFERGTTDRIRYRRYNERTGKEVDLVDIVRGYDDGMGEPVVFEGEELERIAPEASRSIGLTSFVEPVEIDPVQLGRSYWLLPGSAEAARAYGLLGQAMARTGLVGIAAFVLRRREHLAVVRPREPVLALDTLVFAEEIRDPEALLGGPLVPAQQRGRELEMAVGLIEMMRAPWRPQEYRDTYTERVRALIESKRAGRPLDTGPGEPERAPSGDLVDLLTRSLSASRRRQPPRQDLSRLSRAELERLAKEAGVRGRSVMTREELIAALSEPSKRR